MDEDDDDVPTCPLCLEELDATDRAVKACQCGYQVCLWCLHHIREQHSARCPACRTPYEEQNFKFTEVNPEEAAKEAKERATAKKEKERREKLKEIEKERARAVAVSQQKAKSNLKHARILQRNLVYVIGLSLTLAREEVMRRADMFGKFGRLLRILINRSHPFNADAPGGPSISAYVQYYRDSDASAAVRSMNNAVFDGREIRCAIATTKYCDVFVKNINSSDPAAGHHCGNQHCMYYHSLSLEPVLTREEVLARQLGPPPPAHLFVGDPRRQHLPALNFHRSASPPSSAPFASNPAPALPTSSSSVHIRAVGSRPQPTLSSGISPPLPVSQATLPHISVPIPSASTSNPSRPISIPTNGASTYENSHQPPRASSPHMRSMSIPEVGRKPAVSQPAASPSRSPQGTPPGSPPAPRRQPPRVNRSPFIAGPGSSGTASAGVVANGNGLSGPSAPQSFYTAPVGSQPLPSNASWASSQQGRGSSGSPPRRGVVIPPEDSARARPRIQVRRGRDNAPPGFEDSSLSNVPSMPSRPPGFDSPAPNQGKRSPGKSDVNRSHVSTTATSGSAPPGFGPSPSSPRAVSTGDSGLTDVAVAWAQEASTDQVFSTSDRRSRRPVGQPGKKTTSVTQGDIDARSELAQVLAKIGGDLGVSSEFQNVTFPGPPESPVAMPMAGPNSRSVQPALGSLFGAQGFQESFGTSGSSKTVGTDQRPSTNQTPAFRSALKSPFGRGGGSPPRSEVASARRNNSRFGFARRDAQQWKGASVAAAIPTPKAAAVPGMERAAPFSMVTKLDNAASSSNVNVMRTEPHVFSEVTRNVAKAPTPVPAVQPVSRQSRSRFDFVDRPTTQSKSQNLTSTILNSAMGQANASAEMDPASDAFGASFANLSTAEKLASIFSSAQSSSARLPPMPIDGAAAEPVPSSHRAGASAPIVSKSVKKSGPEVLAGTGTMPLSTKEQTKRTSHVPARSAQFAPPGFREAAPGISPESTAVDVNQTLTSSGVATKVVSGVLKVGGEEKLESAVPIDDAISSGNESLEEERKRSRAQRRRDKKARQLKEAAEKKVTEPMPSRLSHTSGSNEEGPGKVIDKSDMVHDSELREIKYATPGQILVKPKESPKQLKPVKLSDDPGRFMSVSELEREVEAAMVREAQLRDRLQELQRKIQSYDNIRT